MFRFVLAAVFICCAGSAHAQLAGSYSIGPGGDYLSISDAVADLNANGVSDEVSFKLTAGAFDEQVTINSFTRFGPADIPVTFQGTGTTVWEFSGQSSAANWVVRLLGADHVTFEGITFEAAGTSPNGRLIVFQSVSSSNGATNNTVKDCTLLGFLGLNSDASSLVYEAASNRGNDDNRFQDNTFTYGYAGVDFRGAATPTGSQGIEVIGNTFEAQTRAGVWIDGQNAEVDNNTLTNAIWATSSFRGLELPNAAGSEVTDNVVDLADGAIGIYVRGSVDPVTVANNMVSGHAGTVTAGIDVSGGSIDVVFNSVLIQSAGTSAAPIRTGSTMGAIRNNI
ncbi:MAG: right-handed parallel beta-helix repeat-containing protein, partial [Bacteroidota bacterium]